VCHSPLPKFVGKQNFSTFISFSILKIIIIKQIINAGTGVEVDMHGKRQLHLHNHGETYEMNCPNFLFRFLPIPGIDWVGNVTIRCLETGLVAELSYIRQSFFGFGSGNRRRIKGKIFDSLTKNVLYNIDGHWDRYISISISLLSFICLSLILKHIYQALTDVQTIEVIECNHMCQTVSVLSMPGTRCIFNLKCAK